MIIGNIAAAKGHVLARLSVGGWSLVFFAAIFLVLSAIPSQERSLRLYLQSEAPGTVQVYFDLGAGLSEEQSAVRTLAGGRGVLSFPLPTGTTKRVRIDPSGAGPLTISGIDIASGRARISEVPLVLSGAADLSVTPLPAGQMMLTVGKGATDAQVWLSLPHGGVESYSLPGLARVLFLASLVSVFLVALSGWQLRSGGGGAACVGGAVVALCLTIALLSTTARAVHPDEALHWADGSFFISNWIPPSIAGDELLASFRASPYGVSYLFDWNIAYFFAGKFAAALSHLSVSPEIALRLFNVALLVATLLVLAKLFPRTPAMWIAFLTPQAWYVFSYFNNDAFPLAVSILATALLVSTGRGIQRWIEEGVWTTATGLFALLTALLLLSKSNFLLAVVFGLGWLAITTLGMRPVVVLSSIGALGFAVTVKALGLSSITDASTGSRIVLAVGALMFCTPLALWAYDIVRDPIRRMRAVRFAGVYGVALALAAPWAAMDVAKNGFGEARQSITDAVRDEHAAEPFRPSTATSATEGIGAGFGLAAKGISPAALLDSPHHWHVITARSLFGYYGFMEFTGAAHDFIVHVFALCTVLVLCAVVGLRQRQIDASQLLLCVGMTGMLFYASFLHSWTYDFQPQGRYILGGLAFMLPLLLLDLRRGGVLTKLASLALGVCFALSAYSFIFYGIGRLI